jgi:hypothetical protein
MHRAALPRPGTLQPRHDDVLAISAIEAEARRRLGEAAVRFLEIDGTRALGFARVGDYARERLGISGRELQSFASVAERLERLPLVAGAFRRGELLWSAVRLLCSVADVGSEGEWLERARRLTVQELAEAVRAHRASRGFAATDAVDEATDETEGERRVRFSIACPARVAFLWRRAVELGRRMIGSEVPLWQIAEAIAAEVGSAGGASLEPSVEVSIAVPSEDGKAAVDAPSIPSSRRCRRRPGAVPIRSEDDSDSLDGFDAHDLDVEMRARVAELREIDARLGASLRRILDLRLHRACGFESFEAYVEEEVGISAAKARALVALDRRSAECRAFGAAYRSGELSWVRALAIAPVVSGGDEKGWVSRAREVMVRRLVDEVEWALDRRDVLGEPAAPPPPDARLERPDLQICARPSGADREALDRRVTFFGPLSVVALFRAAVAGLTLPSEPLWRGFERALEHVIREWVAQPRHRDPVFARDGWRCVVPGCSSRRNLHDHHVLFRSRGGGNERENRVAVCVAHHLHGLHRGVVRARGRAPDDILWELGVSPGRLPLLVLRGERYVSPIDL